ncbi:helix-turn-helix domain-containing protein [Acetobacter sicerae]|uniref:helix-turn-helix domain-containing protein n=1 Tax=Acetobacter sicerae TaxID=85325 RepID=UPI00156A870E|nr:helix-turn-helix domain-containing protein [Acetobacter sicerae]
MTPGDIIRTARNKAGLSQRALAKILKVSAGAVGQWETDLTLPTQENWAALRAVLSIQDKLDPSDSSPFGGQVIEDPDELALLRFWRSLTDEKKRAVIDLLHIGRR